MDTELSRPLKAKTMAEIFQANPTPETLVKIACAMDAETSEIGKARGIKTDASFLALIKEQDNKWQAFARRCPEVNPLAFRLVMQKLHPATAAFAWPNLKTETQNQP
jgi:hypothetical protein